MRANKYRGILAIFAMISIFVFFVSSPLNAEEKLVIGVTGGVTGTTAETWVDCERGIKTAITEINESGGINGSMVEYVILDDVHDKAQCANNFRKLAAIKNVIAIACDSTGMCITGAPLAERFKVITMTGSSIGTWKMNDWVFRTTLPDRVTVPYLFKAMKSKLGIKAIGMMYDYADDWSVLCVPVFKGVTSKLGLITPLEPQSYKRGDSDFSAQLTKLKGENVGAIFMPAQVREGSLIIKQARGLGIKSIFCGTSGWISIAALSAAGDAADGVIAVSVFHPSSKRAGAVRFHNRFKKIFPGQKVGSYLDPCWYDSIMLTGEAARRANIKPPVTEEHRIRLRNEWAKIEGWEGATGTFTYKGAGDPLERDGLLIRWSDKDQEFKLIE